ncbi:MAG: hypothetical protein ACOX8W_07285 [bacterium]|jgi:hypothetical protein
MKFNKLMVAALTAVLAGALLFSAGAIAAAPADATPGEWRTGGLCLRIGRSQGGLLPYIADILGLTPDEVAAGRQAGKSMAEIAASQGVEAAELTEEIVAVRTTGFDELVGEGRISAEEAAARRQYLSERVAEQISCDTVCPVDRTVAGGRMRRGCGWQHRARANQ